MDSACRTLPSPAWETLFISIELAFRTETYVDLDDFSKLPDDLCDFLCNLMGSLDLITNVDKHLIISTTPIDLMVATSCGSVPNNFKLEIMVRVDEVYTTIYLHAILVDEDWVAVVTHGDDPRTPVIVQPFAANTLGELAKEMVAVCVRSLA